MPNLQTDVTGHRIFGGDAPPVKNITPAPPVPRKEEGGEPKPPPSALPLPMTGTARTGMALRAYSKKRIKELIGREPKSGLRALTVTQKRLPAILQMALQGLTQKEIAEELTQVEGKKVTMQAVSSTLFRARKNGMLKDTNVKLHELVTPMAVDTLVHHLRKNDKETAFETLKGLGYFRQHAQVKGDVGGNAAVALQVKFELPKDATSTPIITGKIVGTPIQEEDASQTPD